MGGVGGGQVPGENVLVLPVSSGDEFVGVMRLWAGLWRSVGGIVGLQVPMSHVLFLLAPGDCLGCGGGRLCSDLLCVLWLLSFSLLFSLCR